MLDCGPDEILEDLEVKLLADGWFILRAYLDEWFYCSRDCLEVDVVGY